MSLDGKGMNRPGQFLGQRRIDHAVTLNPALAFKGLRHNMNAVMRFTAGPVAGMPRMKMRLVDHGHTDRRKGFCQFAGNDIGHCHGID